MGERKGTNKYYPPDFDPAKHGSLNKYHGSHPLRERARKLAQGILVIRFEMPYNVWCDGCQNHIGMGVRYNAEKKKVGAYYTTPIYRFRMRCHLCSHPIELQTDPAGCDYAIVSGARRKEERWDMRDNSQVLPTGAEEQARLAADAMYRLEHGAADRAVLQRAAPTLASLQEAQSAWRDDFGLNSMLRRRFREEKAAQREEEEEAEGRAKVGLRLPLLREDEADRRLAALLKLHSPDSYEEKQRMKRTQICARSWFAPPAAAAAPPGDARSRAGTRGGPSAAAPPPPPSPGPSPAVLGIVRRRGGEGASGGPPAAKGGPPPAQEPPTQAPPAQDPPTQPPPAQTPPASLVADYSGSSSEAEST